MNIKNITNRKYLGTFLLLMVGFFAGWIVFHQPTTAKLPKAAAEVKSAVIWTCSMHPQIRKIEPGLCPLCAMDLIPLTQDAAQIDPNTISMSEDAARIAEVQTTIISKHETVKQVRLYGQIEADERLVQTQASHLAGRIEQLQINFTGEEIKKGQPVAQIYSPSLITAQQELFEALKMKDTAIISAAREKFRQWKFTDNQIAEIEKGGQVKTNFDISANVSGIVTVRKVNRGDYVQQGTVLYEIADLSHVWVLFDAYESDLPCIRKGDKISFTLQSLPGHEFSGTVAFIDPVVDAGNRVAKLRIDVTNRENLLKPGMFVTGNLKAHLANTGNSLTIPHSSVLWTGTRSIVYVKVPGTTQPTFLLKEITLGPDLGTSFVVTEGLEDGEEIVTNGTFSIDASAQLLGKPSMMDRRSDSTSKPDAASIKKITATPELQAQISEMYSAYDELKNAFVASDAKKASTAATKLSGILKKKNNKFIGSSEIDVWHNFSSVVELETKNITDNSDIEKQRLSFSPLSNGFYKILKLYGSGQPVYYQYCPMAFDNKGAFWLSETKNIKNPYFGNAMLTCGETKEVIN